MAPSPLRVFVSHSRADSDVARKLADTLRAEGVDAWVDAYVTPGARWQDVIRRQLDAADAFVLLISPEPSAWTRFELSEVLKRAWADGSKIVLPVLIGSADLPGYLRDQDAIRVDKPSGRGLDDVLQHLVGGGNRRGLRRTEAGEMRLSRRLEELEKTAAGMAEAAEED